MVTDSDDLDGDSQDDRVIADANASVAADANVGKVDVRSGDDNQLLVRLKGIASGGKFGFAAWASTDLGSDGAKDVIVGAPDESTGRVYVFQGPFTASGELILESDAAAIAIANPDSDAGAGKFGDRVMAVNDLNDDGFPDVMIRGQGPAVQGGMEFRTYFFSGADGSHIRTVRGADGFDDGGAGQYGLREGEGAVPCCGDVWGKGGLPDGIINTDDLLALLGAWGACPAPPQECPADCAPCEEPNGVVDTDDLLQVLGAWGPCDYDGDGMPDNWELEHGLDPYSDDGDGDADDDGVSNIQEFQLGIDPQNADTDGDGVNDGREVNQGTNPANPNDFAPNSGDVIWVKVTIGDQGNGSCGGAFSDLWEMRINGEPFVASPTDYSGNPQTTNKTFLCPNATSTSCGSAYKSVWTHSNPIALKKGKSYAITVKHRGTCFTDSNPGTPADPHIADYDVTANLQVVAPPGGGAIAPHILDDSTRLFGSPAGTPQCDQTCCSYQNPVANKTAWLHVPDVRLKSISFEENGIIKADKGDQALFTMPQWRDANLDGDVVDVDGDAADRRFPVAQIAGQALHLREVEFIALLGDLNPQSVVVSAFGTHGLAFEEEVVPGDGVIVTGPIASMTDLPNEIDVDDELELTWSVEFTGPGNQVVAFEDMQSDVQLYRCRASGQNTHCQTVYEIACRGDAPLDLTVVTDQQIIDRTWAHFTDRDVRRVADNMQMKYYGTWDIAVCDAVTTSELIKDADGQCTAWASLLRDALSINAVNRDIIQIVGNDLVPVDGFLVNAWNYVGPGISPDARFPFINTPDSPLHDSASFDWLYNEVDDQAGIPGQGSSNPLSYFESHILVQGANGALYDPSYGVLHASILALQIGPSSAMAGFARATQLNEPAVGADLDGDGDMNDMNVAVYLIGQHPGQATGQQNLVINP